jgi:hypothetical protein
MAIKQHSSISTWAPDEVAECIGGLGEDIGRRLWGLVQDRPFSEEPVVSRQTWWKHLTEEDQFHINDCVTKEFGPDTSRD